MLGPIRLPVSLSLHSPRHQRGVAHCGGCCWRRRLIFLICLFAYPSKEWACFSVFAGINFVWLSLKASLGSLLCVLFPSLALSSHYCVVPFHCIAKITFEAGSLVQRRLFLLIFCRKSVFVFSHSATVAVAVHANFQIAAAFIQNKASFPPHWRKKKEQTCLQQKTCINWFVFKADQRSQICRISAFFFFQNVDFLLLIITGFYYK